MDLSRRGVHLPPLSDEALPLSGGSADEVGKAAMPGGDVRLPNQINNVLAFPGFFRGILDSGAHEITDECLLAAAAAIVDCVKPDELNANYRSIGVRPRRRARARHRGAEGHHLNRSWRARCVGLRHSNIGQRDALTALLMGAGSQMTRPMRMKNEATAVPLYDIIEW